MEINVVGWKIIQLRIQKIPRRKIMQLVPCSSSTLSKYISYLDEHPELIEQSKTVNIDELDDIVGVEKKSTEKAKQLLRQLRSQNPSYNVDYNFRLREACKTFLMSPVGGKCQICGYDKCLASLVFHHLDKMTKSFGISGSKFTYDLRKLIVEASKCVVLCHNCHSEIHYIEDRGDKNLNDLKPLDFSGIQIPDNPILWYFNNKLTTV